MGREGTGLLTAADLCLVSQAKPMLLSVPIPRKMLGGSTTKHDLISAKLH